MLSVESPQFRLLMLIVLYAVDTEIMSVAAFRLSQECTPARAYFGEVSNRRVRTMFIKALVSVAVPQALVNLNTFCILLHRTHQFLTGLPPQNFLQTAVICSL